MIKKNFKLNVKEEIKKIFSQNYKQLLEENEKKESVNTNTILNHNLEQASTEYAIEFAEYGELLLCVPKNSNTNTSNTSKKKYDPEQYNELVRINHYINFLFAVSPMGIEHFHKLKSLIDQCLKCFSNLFKESIKKELIVTRTKRKSSSNANTFIFKKKKDLDNKNTKSKKSINKTIYKPDLEKVIEQKKISLSIWKNLKETLSFWIYFTFFNYGIRGTKKRKFMLLNTLYGPLKELRNPFGTIDGKISSSLHFEKIRDNVIRNIYKIYNILNFIKNNAELNIDDLKNLKAYILRFNFYLHKARKVARERANYKITREELNKLFCFYSIINHNTAKSILNKVLCDPDISKIVKLKIEKKAKQLLAKFGLQDYNTLFKQICQETFNEYKKHILKTLKFGIKDYKRRILRYAIQDQYKNSFYLHEISNLLYINNFHHDLLWLIIEKIDSQKTRLNIYNKLMFANKHPIKSLEELDLLLSKCFFNIDIETLYNNFIQRINDNSATFLSLNFEINDYDSGIKKFKILKACASNERDLFTIPLPQNEFIEKEIKNSKLKNETLLKSLKCDNETNELRLEAKNLIYFFLKANLPNLNNHHAEYYTGKVMETYKDMINSKLTNVTKMEIQDKTQILINKIKQNEQQDQNTKENENKNKKEEDINQYFVLAPDLKEKLEQIFSELYIFKNNHLEKTQNLVIYHKLSQNILSDILHNLYHSIFKNYASVLNLYINQYKKELKYIKISLKKAKQQYNVNENIDQLNYNQTYKTSETPQNNSNDKIFELNKIKSSLESYIKKYTNDLRQIPIIVYKKVQTSISAMQINKFNLSELDMEAKKYIHKLQKKIQPKQIINVIDKENQNDSTTNETLRLLKIDQKHINSVEDCCYEIMFKFIEKLKSLKDDPKTKILLPQLTDTKKITKKIITYLNEKETHDIISEILKSEEYQILFENLFDFSDTKSTFNHSQLFSLFEKPKDKTLLTPDEIKSNYSDILKIDAIISICQHQKIHLKQNCFLNFLLSKEKLLQEAFLIACRYSYMKTFDYIFNNYLSHSVVTNDSSQIHQINTFKIYCLDIARLYNNKHVLKCLHFDLARQGIFSEPHYELYLFRKPVYHNDNVKKIKLFFEEACVKSNLALIRLLWDNLHETLVDVDELKKTIIIGFHQVCNCMSSNVSALNFFLQNNLFQYNSNQVIIRQEFFKGAKIALKNHNLVLFKELLNNIDFSDNELCNFINIAFEEKLKENFEKKQSIISYLTSLINNLEIKFKKITELYVKACNIYALTQDNNMKRHLESENGFKTILEDNPKEKRQGFFELFTSFKIKKSIKKRIREDYSNNPTSISKNPNYFNDIINTHLNQIKNLLNNELPEFSSCKSNIKYCFFRAICCHNFILALKLYSKNNDILTSFIQTMNKPEYAQNLPKYKECLDKFKKMRDNLCLSVGNFTSQRYVLSSNSTNEYLLKLAHDYYKKISSANILLTNNEYTGRVMIPQFNLIQQPQQQQQENNNVVNNNDNSLNKDKETFEDSLPIMLEELSLNEHDDDDDDTNSQETANSNEPAKNNKI